MPELRIDPLSGLKVIVAGERGSRPGAFLDVNDAAVRHYGYTREEFLAMTIRDIRPPEEVPQMLAVARAPHPDGASQGVFRHRTRSGEIIDVEVFLRDVAVRRCVMPSDYDTQVMPELDAPTGPIEPGDPDEPPPDQHERLPSPAEAAQPLPTP